MKILKKLRGTFSSPLPNHVEAFDQYCDEIFKDYGLPDDPSYRHAIASMIMHLGPTIDRVPRSYFAKSVRKAMSNQIAFLKIEKIREEEKRKQAEATALKSEVTPQSESSSVKPLQDQAI